MPHVTVSKLPPAEKFGSGSLKKRQGLYATTYEVIIDDTNERFYAKAINNDLLSRNKNLTSNDAKISLSIEYETLKIMRLLGLGGPSEMALSESGDLLIKRAIADGEPGNQVLNPTRSFNVDRDWLIRRLLVHSVLGVYDVRIDSDPHNAIPVMKTPDRRKDYALRFHDIDPFVGPSSVRSNLFETFRKINSHQSGDRSITGYQNINPKMREWFFDLESNEEKKSEVICAAAKILHYYKINKTEIERGLKKITELSKNIESKDSKNAAAYVNQSAEVIEISPGGVLSISQTLTLAEMCANISKEAESRKILSYIPKDGEDKYQSRNTKPVLNDELIRQIASEIFKHEIKVGQLETPFAKFHATVSRKAVSAELPRSKL
jgi:hypothetical protein